MLERLFHIRASGSTVGRELRGGVVTFLTLSYILFVQPVVMSYTIKPPEKPVALTALADGQPVPPDLVEVQQQYDRQCAEQKEEYWQGFFVATCVASAVACLLMAFLANYPFALAPAMGHNFFFAFAVCGAAKFGGFGLSWQQALAANFLSGAVFLALSFVGLREAVMHAIPDGLKYAIAVGIGFLIAFVGLQYGGLVVDNPGALVQRGNLAAPVALLTMAGLAILSVLLVLKVRGALLWGILLTGGIALAATWLDGRYGWFGGSCVLATFPEQYVIPKIPTATMFQLDFRGLFDTDFVNLLIIIFIFLFLDLFDTVGTLIGVGERGGMLVDGKLPRAGRALFSDAAGTVVGTLLGTSTVTSYIESASGIAEGARTGLASVVTAALLLVSLVAYPVMSMFGAEVAGGFHPVLAPVLIIVGSLMMASVRKIEWSDYAEAIPAFLCMVVMLFSLSIADGIAWGFIAYALLKLVSGKGRQVGAVVYIVSILAILRYILRPM